VKLLVHAVIYGIMTILDTGQMATTHVVQENFVFPETVPLQMQT
jgi:hypothetical protein